MKSMRLCGNLEACCVPPLIMPRINQNGKFRDVDVAEMKYAPLICNALVAFQGSLRGQKPQKMGANACREAGHADIGTTCRVDGQSRGPIQIPTADTLRGLRL